MSKEFDFKNYKDHTLTRPRDEAWDNWKSWKDSKIGDKVEGYIVDAFFRPEEKNEDGSTAFRAQRGITIKQENGELINLGVKYLSFVLAPTDNLRIGDPIVVELGKVLTPTKKGQNGAKVFNYFGTNLEENKDNRTVKELTDEDKLAGGTSVEEEESEEELDEPFGSFDDKPKEE